MIYMISFFLFKIESFSMNSNFVDIKLTNNEINFLKKCFSKIFSKKILKILKMLRNVF